MGFTQKYATRTLSKVQIKRNFNTERMVNGMSLQILK